MKLSDFDYDLPEELIATRPARPRSASRLLVAGPQHIRDAHMRDLGQFLRAGDRLVLNDTRVIPARLRGIRQRGSGPQAARAQIELTLLEALPGGSWRALVRPLRKLRAGETVQFEAGLEAEFLGREGDQGLFRFNLEGAAFDAALQKAGAMPLPPYIAARRCADARDAEDYQPIWAERPGAVASPTASLHFDTPLLKDLAARDIAFSRVTLHVGAGTFLPVKHEDISRHRMHGERGEVSAQAAREIAATRAEGGRIIPVGTTALRVLETAAPEAGRIAPWSGVSEIFITPGYRFRICDALITNFHLPRSTLLMLVSALMGQARIREIYAYAIARRYRFFSYGDASLLLPSEEPAG